MDEGLLFLGTGGSMGVPVIGCSCATCTSTDPRNKRTRPSALLKIGGKNILIDIGTDFREQALRENITSLDGIILTHAHQDHIGGIDDLRPLFFERDKPLPLLILEETYDEVSIRYHYMVSPKKKSKTVLPKFDFKILKEDRGVVDFLNQKVQFFTYRQVGMLVMGIRIGNFAYVTDILEYPDTIISDLDGVDTLVLSALRETNSPMHFSISQAIAFTEEVGANKTYFTHIAHEIEYVKISSTLPPNISLSYDGLFINL